jgi:hypothetical protein
VLCRYVAQSRDGFPAQVPKPKRECMSRTKRNARDRVDTNQVSGHETTRRTDGCVARLRGCAAAPWVRRPPVTRATLGDAVFFRRGARPGSVPPPTRGCPGALASARASANACRIGTEALTCVGERRTGLCWRAGHELEEQARTQTRTDCTQAMAGLSWLGLLSRSAGWINIPPRQRARGGSLGGPGMDQS